MSPRSKAQFAALRDKSMAAIKSAALELFGQQGYHFTTVSQIAKAAGVSKGLLYNYYSGKEELLNAIIMDVVEMGEQFLDQLMTAALTPLERITAIVDGSIAMVQSDPHYWKLLTSLSLQINVLDEALTATLKNRQAAANARLATIFREMGYADPERETLHLEATMDGMMIHYLTQLEDYPIQAMRDYILQQYQRFQKPE
ncbi:MAG: TetR family transcriptional regulator [Lewinellaceae bacterium]|nr:TetR family transcriptional regulator [Lewinellaceae bacterium]